MIDIKNSTLFLFYINFHIFLLLLTNLNSSFPFFLLSTLDIMYKPRLCIPTTTKNCQHTAPRLTEKLFIILFSQLLFLYTNLPINIFRNVRFHFNPFRNILLRQKLSTTSDKLNFRCFREIIQTLHIDLFSSYDLEKRLF